MSLTAIDTTYSSDEVCRLVGITYRQLDYWLRCGYIVIESPMNAGSGSRRRFTVEEVTAIRTVVDKCIAAQAILEDFSSGTLWETACSELLQKGTSSDRRIRGGPDQDREGSHRQRHPSAGGRSRARVRRVASVGGGQASDGGDAA